jgi:hypothetical protein
LAVIATAGARRETAPPGWIVGERVDHRYDGDHMHPESPAIRSTAFGELW